MAPIVVTIQWKMRTRGAALGIYAIRTTGKLNISVRSRIPEERAARKRGERWRPKSRKSPHIIEAGTSDKPH